MVCISWLTPLRRSWRKRREEADSNIDKSSWIDSEYADHTLKNPPNMPLFLRLRLFWSFSSKSLISTSAKCSIFMRMRHVCKNRSGLLSKWIVTRWGGSRALFWSCAIDPRSMSRSIVLLASRVTIVAHLGCRPVYSKLITISYADLRFPDVRLLPQQSAKNDLL